MLSDKEIVKKFDECRSTSENHFSDQYDENKINNAFYSGNKEVAFKGYNIDPKEVVYFNYVHPVINSVAGFIIQHRRQPQCFAKIANIQQQQALSEYVNNISETFRNNANFDQIESKQDLDMLICGYGAVDTVIGYDNEHGSDPYGQGEIDIENIDPNDVWWDVSAKETNALDARYIARKKIFDKEDIELLYDVEADELDETTSDDYTASDWQPVYNEGSYMAERKLEAVAGTKERQVVVYSFQWWEYEKFYRVENPIYAIENPEIANLLYQAMQRMEEIIGNEEQQENTIYDIDLRDRYISLNKKRYKFLKETISRIEEQTGEYIPFEYVEYDRRCYYTAIISGKTILNKYKNIHQAGFTIQIKTGYFDSTKDMWFGLVSLMREPAKYNAKALTEILKSVGQTTKGGLLVEKGATDNIGEFEYNYKKQNSVVWLNDGGIMKVKEKQQPALPSGYENIALNSEDAIRKVTNITPELLGNTENKNATAALERQRIKQAMTSLAVFFDSITLYQTENMRLIIDYIRVLAENAPNKLVRIIGQDGMTKFMPLMSDKLAFEFDVDIGEAPDSPTQREENIALLSEMADKFIQLGMGNIYPMVIQQMNGISEADKQQIIEMITPKPQPPDPTEQRTQAQMLAMMKAETRKTEAEALDKQVSATERQAKVAKIASEINVNKAKVGTEKINNMTNLYNTATLPSQNNEQQNINGVQQ